MDNFKTYYQINEGVIDKIKSVGAKVGGAVGSIGSSREADANLPSMTGATGKVKGAVGAVVPDKVKGMTEGDFLVPGKPVETYEDLNRLITGVINKAKFGAVKDQAVGAAVDLALGWCPPCNNAKTVIDFFKGVSKQPDDQDTGSFIDRLDVDDDLAKIIDDPIEGKFLKHVQKKISTKKGKIRPDWDINKDLKQFLSTNFGGRTVAGGKDVEPKADPHLKTLKVE